MELKNRDIIIIFDGACMLCNSAVHFLYRKLKHKSYHFIPSQSKSGEELIEKYQLGTITEDTLVLISNNQVSVKSTAVFKILTDLPLIWRILLIFKILPVKLLDLLYDIIANNRYIFTKDKEGQSCYHEIDSNQY